MFGRDAPRRSARLSPPGAGAPSGAAVAKVDIAPVAKEPDFRTPGKSLANRAPWRSPGAALRDRDRENNYVSARKKAVRKLSARSPATAAMASGAKRNGRPRFTPAEMRTPSVTPSKNPSSTEDDDEHDDREDETKTTETEEPRQERTPLADLASVPITTVLLTPPSTRSRSRAAEANKAKAAAASEADAKAAMPPPPPKPRVSPLANVTTNPFLDDEATMKVPALAPYNAAFEALQMGTAAALTADIDEHDDDDDAEAEEPAGQRDVDPSASPALTLFAPTEVGDDSVLIADDADGSFFGGDRSTDDRSMNLENGDDDLPTPTTTSAFDAALDIAAATVAIPAFSADTRCEQPTSKTPAKTPSRDILNPRPNEGGISANEISTGFLGPAALVAAGSTLKEMLAEGAAELAVPHDGAEEDPTLGPTLGHVAEADPDDAASSPQGGGRSEEGAGRVPAGAVLDAIAHPQVAPPVVSESAAVPAPSPIAALSPPTLEPAPTEEDTALAKNRDESPPRSQPAATPSPVRRSPRLAAMRTASFTPASPAVVEMDAAPTAAERRAAELQALVERQAVELLEQREALERQQMMMRSEASRQAAQLEAQREAMMNQKRQMENEAALAFQRAEAAAQEQARMRAEFQKQLEARRAEEDATRARLAAMASEAVAAKEEAARAARAAAEAARRQPSAPSPFPLSAVKSVEDELRACREELARRSAESAAVSQRMQTLQREETELFNRAAELQRRMLEMVIKGNPKISPAAAAALAQPLISSVSSSGAASGASAMPPPPPRMMDMDLSLARPGEVVDAIAAAAEMVLQPREPTASMTNSPAMVSMDSFAAAAAATPGARGPAPSLTPLAPMSAGVARAMEAAVAPSVVDEDGFIVMDYAAAGAASMPIADAAKIGNDGNGVFMTPAITPPAARALEMAAAAADACPALVVTPTSASQRGGGVGNPAAAGIATRRNALQIVELRKEVVNLQFLGGHEGGTSAGMLMAATKDGAVRLFAPGSRRAAAMIRGPKQGLAAAVAVGTEAFIAAAGRDAHVARHDLATGRELGVLLPTIDGVSGGGPELTCIRGGGATGGPVVVAAGEGGDVFLWDVRAAPRVSSRRASLVGGAATPAMTMHVPGASRTLSLSLSDALGGGAHGTAPASLALVASNGGRVFDLRVPGRPARLAPAEGVSGGSRARTRAPRRRAHAQRAGRPRDVAADGWWGVGWVGRVELPDRRTRPARGGVCVGRSGRGEGGAVDVRADGRPGRRRRRGADDDGETGDGFRVFDASTGDVVAEWGGDGERTDVGVGATATAGVGGWRRSERDEPRPSITAAGWGCGALDGAFGGSSFAVGTSDGVVRVYGPGA